MKNMKEYTYSELADLIETGELKITIPNEGYVIANKQNEWTFAGNLGRNLSTKIYHLGKANDLKFKIRMLVYSIKGKEILIEWNKYHII